MLKAANVEIVEMEKIGSGMVCVIVMRGRSCKGSSRCRAEAAQRIGELSAAHVIPRPECRDCQDTAELSVKEEERGDERWKKNHREGHPRT